MITGKFWILASSDATHLGGPMGSEYEVLLWEKAFNTLEEAKAHAEDYHRRALRDDRPFVWEEHKKGRWSADAYSRIYRIHQEECFVENGSPYRITRLKKG